MEPVLKPHCWISHDAAHIFILSNRLDDTDPVGGGDNDGSSLLPCEFCNELFPMDILVQHQVRAVLYIH